MPWRLSISLSVVGERSRRRAASFWTPPARCIAAARRLFSYFADGVVEDEALRREGLGARDRAADGVGELVEVDEARAEDDGALEDVLQLADVAGPVVVEERLHRLGGHGRDRPLVLPRRARDERVDEERDVLLALPQRREADGDDAEAVEEVLAELPFLDEAAEVGVRRGDDADVRVDRLDGADGEELALLEDPEELGLGLERHGADLVEEDRPAVGDLEEALLLGDRSGEGPLRVAEEVRLEEVGRHRAGVDGDERAGGAQREAVEGARDELLAGAALARDEDRRARGGGLADRLEDLLHRGRAADHLGEVVRRRRGGPSARGSRRRGASSRAPARRGGRPPRCGTAWGRSGTPPPSSR